MELEEVKKLFEKAVNYRVDRKDYTWKVLDTFDRGDQWSLSSKPRWFPKPVTNYINYIKRYKVASVSVDNLTPTIRPLSREDIKSSEYLQEIFNNIWYYTGAKFAVRSAIERCKLLGTGFVCVSYDPNAISGGTNTMNTGKMVVKAIDPSNVFPDPNAFTIDDCDYIFIAERKTKKWVYSQGLFRKDNSKPAFDKEEVENSSKGDDYKRGEIYQRDYDTEQDQEIVNFVSFYHKEVDDEGNVELRVSYYANWVELCEPITLPFKSFPIVPLYDQEQQDDFWGISDCEQALPNQKTLNNLESIMALYATLLQLPQKLLNKASGINAAKLSKYGNAPGMVWETNGDINNTIKNLDPPEMSQSVIAYRNLVEQNIQTVSGVTSAYIGSSVGSITTSGGVNTLINRSLVLDKDFNIQLEKFLKKLSLLIIEVFKAYVDTESPYYVRVDDTNPNVQCEYGFLEITPDELSALADTNYDVIIETNSNNVDDIRKRKEEAQNLMQLQLQFQADPPLITIPEYLSMSDFSNKTQIIDRVLNDSKEKRTERMQEFVMQVMQMLSDPNIQQNPQALQMTIQQLVDMGVEMTNPYKEQEQGNTKLGNVQKKQQANPNNPMQPLNVQ